MAFRRGGRIDKRHGGDADMPIGRDMRRRPDVRHVVDAQLHGEGGTGGRRAFQRRAEGGRRVFGRDKFEKVRW